MKKFFSFLIRQTVAIVLVVALVLGFGVYSTINMPINLLPDINVPMVCVQVIYPGANAQSVEKDVTVKLEDGLSSIAGVTDVSSYSYDNLSALVLSFDYGTDTSEKKSDINSKLTSVDLPDGVSTSVYDIDLNAEALAVLSVTSDKGDDEDACLKSAYTAAEELAAKLRAVDGVENVEIKGGPKTSYVIRPFGGLELLSPLIVQAFSYGALDIPLGNLTQNGVNVQITNNSDVASLGDIEEMPITLPASIVTLLGSVKRITGYYEDATADDLVALDNDLGDGVIAVLGELDGYTSEEISDLASLKTYMNIAGGYTAEQLKSFKRSSYYNRIYEAVTEPPTEEGGERTPKSDDEIEDIVSDLKEAYPAFSAYITTDMLRAVRDGKIDGIIAFREELETTDAYKEAEANDEYYEPTVDDYYNLEINFVKVYSGVYGADYPANLTEEEQLKVKYNVEFALKTSATGLAAIADGRREAEEAAGDGEVEYSPTDSECAALFIGTDLASEHPIITVPTFMAFVRSGHYEENMAELIATRRSLEENKGEGEEITAGEFYALYCRLELEGVFEFTLSEELLGFVLKTDFSELSSDNLVTAVKDIATVAIEDEYSSYVYFSDGRARVIKGTIIEVYKSNGANASAVVGKVKNLYADYLKGDTLGTKITLLDDQSEFISDSISNVLVSMLIGGLLAVIVIFLFLKKIRTSLIVAVTMPLSVLAALICLNLMGITLNMVSLGGLAVGIGMLVDNSIVVIESITKHRDAGKSAFEAAVDGTCEVGGALIGSTLTTVCVFIPIIFSGGLTGEIFTDLSWAVIFSLAFSLIVAVTVIPALYSLFNGGKKLLAGEKVKAGGAADNPAVAEAVAETSADEAPTSASTETFGEENAEGDGENAAKPEEPKKKNKFIDWLKGLKEPKVMNGITSFYGKALPKILDKKLVTVLVALAVFGASVGMLFVTGTEFLPSIDKGQIEVNMTYASGVSLADIQTNASGFAEVLRGDGDGEGLADLDYLSVSVGKNGLLALTDTGIITVQLKTNRGTSKVVDKIREMADEYKTANPVLRGITVREIDGVVASLMSGADDMSVTVMGNDGEILRKITDEIKLELEKPENGFKDVVTGATDRATQYTLRFDRRKMEELGLDYQTTVLTLRIGIASYDACTVIIDGEEYFVTVEFDENAVTSREELENFVIGADGDAKAIKLKDVLKTATDADGNPVYDADGNPVKVLEEEQEACIRRQNGREMISVTATLPGVDTGTAGKKMQSVAAEVLKKYDGYSFEESGITGYLNDAFGGLVVALVVSFVLLYGVMAVQFSSAVKPLIVMSSIPFSFTGGFLALVITGTTLNVVSFIGLIMLMGVVVNNAIVMLEKIKQLKDEGMQHLAAVQEACKVRLRPIFMTTLTTILALIPLAIGVGQGSELMQPLGIVVMGGLLIGTLVTLIIVPTVYCAIHGLSSKNPDGRVRKEKVKKSKKREA